MDPKPTALVDSTKLPCHVCSRSTSFRRSMTHLHGPPTVHTDIVPICSDCDQDWTKAIFIESVQDAQGPP